MSSRGGSRLGICKALDVLLRPCSSVEKFGYRLVRGEKVVSAIATLLVPLPSSPLTDPVATLLSFA